MRGLRLAEKIHVKSNITVKRAFILSATLPGAGDWYAGNKSRGLLAATIIFISLAVFGLSVASTVHKAFNHLGSTLDGSSSATLNVPIVSLAAAMLLAYGMWLYTMYGSVEAAAKEDEGARSRGLALVLSYICPGSGQVYVGSPFWGQVIFYTFFLGVLFSLFSYRDLIGDLQALAEGGALAGATPHTVPQLLALPLARVNFSIGQMMQTIARMFAIYLSFSALAIDHKLSLWDGLVGLVGTWFCPGAGHLLMNKEKWGSRVFKATIATLALFALMVRAEMLPASWLLTSITWFAIIHYLYTWQTMEKCQTTVARCQSDKDEGRQVGNRKTTNKDFEQKLSIGTACAS